MWLTSFVFASYNFRMEWYQAIILSVIEGLTEYLPVSSTGHIMIGSFFMGIQQDEFVKDFTVAVQFGAILAVVVLYWRKFFEGGIRLLVKLGAAFFPAAVLGLLLKKHIDVWLGSVEIVGWSLIVGGIALIFIERRNVKTSNENTGSTTAEGMVSYRQAAIIGLVQCIAFVPGVSRSAATIIGGVALGLPRKAAAEFSFLLAVPTLSAATFYKVFKGWERMSVENLNLLLVGNLVSFIVGLIAIHTFVAFLKKHDLGVFGYYRIVMGLVVLGLVYGGLQITMG